MNKNTHRHVLFVAQAGIIAALYVVLTWLSALVGLSGQNAIQIRISEALCVLPYFTPAAVSAAVAAAKDSGLPLFSLGSLYMYAEVTDALSGMGLL